METLQLHKPLQPLGGDVQLPGSKSLSNRVLMIRALSGLQANIEGLSDSDDTRHLQQALETIAKADSPLIDIGHAGTDMRFLTAYLASRPGSYELTGSARMQQRPIAELVDVLKALGADIRYKQQEGFPPLLIRGNTLQGGKAKIKAHVSSQFISALLLAAPGFTAGLELELEGEPVSRPYIAMTVELMKRFGAALSWDDRTIRVAAKPYAFPEAHYRVEADWSAASYYYSLVALSEPGTGLALQGLEQHSLQADSACAFLYSRFGVETRFSGSSVILSKTAGELPLQLPYDFTDCPDIAQTLACTCAALNVPFHFTGLQTLRIKETDRIDALRQELAKFGLKLHTTGQSLSSPGGLLIPSEALSIATYHDHRMAMSFAPMVMKTGRLRIEDPGVVSKSYPAFWDDLEKIGIQVHS